MKKSMLHVVLLWIVIAQAKSQPAVDQHPPTLNQNVQNPMKLTVKQPWKNVMVRFVVPGGKAENIKAREAVYQTGNQIPARVLAGTDTHTAKFFVIQAVAGGIYVPRPSGIVVFWVIPGGTLVWSKSYVEIPSASGNVETAIARFESEFDIAKLRNWFHKGTEGNEVELRDAAPPYFFSEGPEPHGKIFSAAIDAAEMKGNVLRLDLRNPVTEKTASFWIDVDARKVIRSVVEGQELEIPKSRPGLPRKKDSESSPK